MFKDTTKIEVNKSVMIEALQEWWDKRVTANARKNKIINVTAKNSSGSFNGSINDFEITLKEEDEKE